MPIQSPAEVAKEVDEMAKHSKNLMDEATKDLVLYKKKSAEFETIRGGLLEGADVIVEHQKELATMYASFDKMTIKLAVIRKEMVTLGASMRETYKMVEKNIPSVRNLAQDTQKLMAINKGNALLKTAEGTCKTLDAKLVDTKEKLGMAAGDCEGLPGDVARPK